MAFASLCLYGAEEGEVAVVEEVIEEAAVEAVVQEEQVSHQEIAALDNKASQEILMQKSPFTQELNPPKGVEANVLPELKKEKSVIMSVGLSYLFPGLGHLYLGEIDTARGLIGSATVGIGGVGLEAARVTRETALPGAMAYQTALFYGIYAAYRDTHKHNQATTKYVYDMPMDSFEDLSYAPFQWGVIKKKEVWGGLLGFMAAAIGTSYASKKALKKYGDKHSHHEEDIELPSAAADPFNVKKPWGPLIAFPVGLSEEAYFRGFLQSLLMQDLPPWGAITLSSLSFGAAHIGNAQLIEKEEDRWTYYAFSVPFITGLGGYLGWLTYKNHSLKESVALHAWYDFVLFAGAYGATKLTLPGNVPARFALSFSF